MMPESLIRAGKMYAKLFRFSVSLSVAFSAFTGFICYFHTLTTSSLFLFIGVLLLAAAASSLNQYQERSYDARMTRTMNRPIQLKQISLLQVLLLTILVGGIGILFLLMGTTYYAAILGIFTFIWYNGIYTPLKSKTKYASIVGSITGSLIPLIGITAAQGPLFSIYNSLCLFMYFWQLSHFSLIWIQYGSEYKKAGFPNFTLIQKEKNLKFAVFLLILTTSLCTLFFFQTGLINKSFTRVLIILINILFLCYFLLILFCQVGSFSFFKANLGIHGYCGLILSALLLESLF